MAGSDTRDLIGRAIDTVARDVPALQQLKIVVRVELPARGDDAVWRVSLPDKEIKRDPAGDSRIDVSVPRVFFNTLAEDPKTSIHDWIEAYHHGHVKVTGEPAVVKLIGNVIERQVARAR